MAFPNINATVSRWPLYNEVLDSRVKKQDSTVCRVLLFRPYPDPKTKQYNNLRRNADDK